jgi:hypothetical protein
MSDKEYAWQITLEWQNMTDGWRAPMSKARRAMRWNRGLIFVFILLLPWLLGDLQKHLEQCIADPSAPSCRLPERAADGR